MNISCSQTEKIIRQHIHTVQPYSTARDEFDGQAEIYLDANENPYPSPYNRYPDPHQRQLKEEIARIKQVEPDQIFIGNGSDEAIDLLIRLCCEPNRDAVVIPDPTYGMYAVSAQINAVPVIRIPLTAGFQLDADAMLEAAHPSVKIIFLCSPNNPSGNLLDKNLVRKIIRSFNGWVVVDEAYIDFADDPGFLPELNQWPNLIVLQTFSKAWGLAGLRTGMAFASKDIVRLLNKIKPPYNISSVVQRLVLDELQKREKVEQHIQEIKEQRNQLEQELKRLSIVQHIYPSDANFLLVRFAEARQVFHYLLKNGIIVRDRSSVRHGTNCLRITIGTPGENRRLLEVLNNFMPS
jgi:histidinol-phosphate aminotransferase